LNNIYYINTFGVANDIGKRYLAIWEVKELDQTNNRFNSKNYEWVKKIYDPIKRFKKGYILDPSQGTIAYGPKTLIVKLFEEIKFIGGKKWI
jgi:hypothetical protein